MHKACPTVLCHRLHQPPVSASLEVSLLGMVAPKPADVLGLFIQFCDHLQEIHSRDTEGGAGVTSQQAKSCSYFL